MEQGGGNSHLSSYARRPCQSEILLLETHDKMDEMAEWMVPMSTGQVEPHIAGRFSSMQVC